MSGSRAIAPSGKRGSIASRRPWSASSGRRNPNNGENAHEREHGGQQRQDRRRAPLQSHAQGGVGFVDDKGGFRILVGSAGLSRRRARDRRAPRGRAPVR